MEMTGRTQQVAPPFVKLFFSVNCALLNSKSTNLLCPLIGNAVIFTTKILPGKKLFKPKNFRAVKDMKSWNMYVSLQISNTTGYLFVTVLLAMYLLYISFSMTGQAC